MTPSDHNRMLGIMHLIYGGFFGLVTLVMLLFAIVLGVGLSSLPQDPNAPPAGFFVAIMAFLVFVYGLLSLPSLIAGYGMLKRRSWARVAGIVAAVLSALSFPFGTALCVYSLWFFFGDAGKAFEHPQPRGEWRGALGDAPASTYGWDAQRSSREHEYQPPPQPPSWRE